MDGFSSIASVKRESVARVLIAALKAHGFSPLDLSDGGLPGVGTALSAGELSIMVPDEEAEDARPLAEALLADMRS